MKKKRLILCLVVVVVAVIVAGTILLVQLNKYKSTIDSMSIKEVDVSAIADGVYTGESDAGLVYAKVEVTVADGKITNVHLVEHKNGQGEPAEVVADRIVEQQKVVVDTVSGATSSSKVIMKAVENALQP